MGMAEGLVLQLEPAKQLGVRGYDDGGQVLKMTECPPIRALSLASVSARFALSVASHKRSWQS
jgi:hypothetical protein